jgi:ferredoxin
VSIRILVDLNRCAAYGQCVFAAPDLFRLEHPNVLSWDYEAGAEHAEAVVRAQLACPVDAITAEITAMGDSR